MAVYPNSIISFTTKTDKVDLASAADMNAVQAEEQALQTAIGKNINESSTTLKTRLAVNLDGNGAIQGGTSFPVTPTPIDGQLFWRTDSDTLYAYNGSAWNPVVAGPSNLFSAYNSADVTLVTTGDVSFDSEDFDTGGNFASSTFTAPASGKYIFTVGLRITTTSTSTGACWEVYLKKNGSKIATLGGSGPFSGSRVWVAGMGGSAILDLATNDTVKVAVTISDPGFSGQTLTIEGSSTESKFTGARIQ